MEHFNSISDFHYALGIKLPENPLFSIIRGDEGKCNSDKQLVFTSNFYCIGFWKLKSGNVGYGKTLYDHNSGSMSFMKPNQKISFTNLLLNDQGFIILINEDFLSGSNLYQEIKKYSYFDYELREALHLSPSEEDIIWNIVFSLEKEYYNNIDAFSREIILSQLDVLLKYGQRFYKRQFIHRASDSGSTVTKFTNLLKEYFEQREVEVNGLPTVTYFADKLNVSTRYLSDLLKQETGKTTIELIHLFLITEAKNLLVEGSLNISEIAFHLGFENANYFSRLFKKEVGMTPFKFKNKHLN